MDEEYLNLTLNEVLAVLHLTGATTINGLPDNILAELPDEQAEERLNGGIETLKQRKLLILTDEDELEIDDKLLALVGAALIPEAVVLIGQALPDGTKEPHFLSTTKYVTVEHFSPRLGIYTFIHLIDKEALRNRINVLLAPLYVQTNKNLEFQHIFNEDLLSAVSHLIRTQDIEKALSILYEQNWDEQIARIFVDDCASATLWTAMKATDLRSDSPATIQTVVVIEGAQHCWLALPIPNSETILLTVASGRTCAETMASYVAVLEQARE